MTKIAINGLGRMGKLAMVRNLMACGGCQAHCDAVLATTAGVEAMKRRLAVARRRGPARHGQGGPRGGGGGRLYGGGA